MAYSVSLEEAQRLFPGVTFAIQTGLFVGLYAAVPVYVVEGVSANGRWVVVGESLQDPWDQLMKIVEF